MFLSELDEEAIGKIEDYYECVRECDFWSHREKILDAMMMANGMFLALSRKGILTREEFTSGVDDMREIYADECKYIQEKLKEGVTQKEAIEQEILGYVENSK